MGRCHIYSLLLLFLLGPSSLILAQDTYCYKSTFVDLVTDPVKTFNWTTEEVETCDVGSLCQETILIIMAGTEAVVVASKGCTLELLEQMTLIRHSPPPGLKVVSFSNYCEENYCNNHSAVASSWIEEDQKPGPTTSKTLYCPTCVALGTCLSAPSVPCPSETSHCYQGKLRISGGDVDSLVEVRGCSPITSCRLMSGIFSIGALRVKEVCPQQTFTQLRKAERGAARVPVSIWGLNLMLQLMLLL